MIAQLDLMLTRMVVVKIHLNSVLDELLWDTLSATQWKQLESIVELLQPFAHFTNVASSEQFTSVGMICPLFKELSLHLEEIHRLHTLKYHSKLKNHYSLLTFFHR